MVRYISNGTEVHYCPCNASSLLRDVGLVFARQFTKVWANLRVILVHCPSQMDEDMFGTIIIQL